MNRILLVCVMLALSMLAPTAASAADPQPIVISVPGPRNLSYLPIDLIPKIGADKAEGVKVNLIHVGGGGVALKNLTSGNADFAVAGVPAAMSLKANGGDVTIVAAVDDAPLFVLMVRSGLKGQVKTIADLKGRVIGVNTGTKASKTTSQQLAELLLESGGISSDMVRIVPAGQSWIEQSSVLLSGAADAVMGDEPFASRLLDDGKVFFLANLADPRTSGKIPGANFLHAAVETRGDILAKEPAKVEKMVRMVRASLQWIARHTPEEVVAALGVTDAEERTSLLRSLRKYPHAFSKDGKFSTRQLADTELFFRATNKGNAAAQGLRIEGMVDDRHAGRGK